MNKKVLTLCAAMLLTGSLSMSAASISFDDFKNQQGVEYSTGVMTFTGDVELSSYQDYLLIDQDNITIEGNWHTLKGHIVVTGKNVTIKNLTVDYYNGAEASISGFNPTVTVNKTAISAYTESITITGCTIKCSSKFWLANAITIFPKSEDAKILIQNNTIKDAKQKKDDDFSSAIIIAQGTAIGGLDGVTTPAVVVKNFDVSKAIVNNTFEECASDYTVVDYSSLTPYSAVQISPLEDKSNIETIKSYIANAAEDATIIFKGAAADLVAAVGNISDKAVVVCNDGNVLYGGAENPDNGLGAVIAGIKPLNEDVFGYKLMKDYTSDYCMLILHSNSNEKDYIIANGETNLATELTANNIADFTNNPKALWKMTFGKDHDGKIWYQFENQDEEKLTVGSGANATTTFFPENNAAYNNGVVFSMDGLDLTVPNKNYFGLYAVGNNILSVKDLMWYENDGFSVTIKYEDEKGEFKKEDIAGNPFQMHLTPMKWNGSTKKFVEFTTTTDGEGQFYLKNAEGNYIVAQKYASSGSTQNQSTYVFTTVTEKALEHDLATGEGNYFGLFQAEVSAKYTDLKTLTAIDVLKVYVANGWAEIGRLDLGTAETPTLAASVSTDLKPILISLGSNKVVNPKTFLQKGKFYTVSKLDKDGKGKYLDVADDKYDGYDGDWFVESSGNDLEIQFALTYDENGKNFVFSNRETPYVKWSLPANQLYYGEGENEYVYGSTTYVIAPVKEHKPTDGYDNETLADVKNNKFHIGFVSGVFDNNAWFTENHEGTNNHTIGLDVDVENALTFTATKYDAARKIEHNATDHTDTYYPTDSIYVISNLGYYDGNTYKETQDTLKIVSYSFVNQWNEPLVYNNEGTSSARYVSLPINPETGKRFASVAEAAPYAEKFVLREDNNKLNLRPVESRGYSTDGTIAWTTWKQEGANKSYLTHQDFGKTSKMYAGDAANGILNEQYLYDRTENDLFVVEPTAKPMYRKVVNNLDTISIFRQENDKQLLFEDGKFLGLKNATQFDFAPAKLADTAYVRYNTYRPQYLLAVDPVVHGETTWCPLHGYGATCEHADTIKGYVEGRYLVNLVDTAIAWDKANKHKEGNPYINSEKYYRLGFVQATHRNDSLIIANDNNRIFLGNNDYNLAKFAFRYVDQNAGSFVIETANYKQLPDATKAEIDGVGYIKWMNGVVVVVDDIENADVFNMNENEEGDPTANENISAGNVVVAGVDGAVVVKGAEGKNVIVSTILGKVVANEVVSSDNAQISAPAGIVVVSVDGESFKVVVK